MPLRARILTPEASLLDEDVNSLVIPGSDGYMGILPKHAPLIAALAPGIVRIRRLGGEEAFFVVGRGAASVERDVATILAETVIPAVSEVEASARLEEWRDANPAGGTAPAD